jgi:hypothetical protein
LHACFAIEASTNVASVDPTGALVRLFDPRRDRWNDHFRLEGPVIQPLSLEGAATAKLLKLNGAERVIERNVL